MGLEREEVHVCVRIAGISRLADQGLVWISEVHSDLSIIGD